MFRTPPKYGMSSYSRVASEMLGCTPWMGALTLLCALLQKAKLLPFNVISQSTNSWAALSAWNLNLIDLFERDTWSSSSRCHRSWASSIAWRSSLFLIGGNPRSLGYSGFSRCPSTCHCFSWMPHFHPSQLLLLLRFHCGPCQGICDLWWWGSSGLWANSGVIKLRVFAMFAYTQVSQGIRFVRVPRQQFQSLTEWFRFID